MCIRTFVHCGGTQAETQGLQAEHEAIESEEMEDDGDEENGDDESSDEEDICEESSDEESSDEESDQAALPDKGSSITVVFDSGGVHTIDAVVQARTSVGGDGTKRGEEVYWLSVLHITSALQLLSTW